MGPQLDLVVPMSAVLTRANPKSEMQTAKDRESIINIIIEISGNSGLTVIGTHETVASGDIAMNDFFPVYI